MDVRLFIIASMVLKLPEAFRLIRFAEVYLVTHRRNSIAECHLWLEIRVGRKIRFKSLVYAKCRDELSAEQLNLRGPRIHELGILFIKFEIS